MQIHHKPIVAALDLGSSKVTILVAELTSNSTFKVLGRSTVFHEGMKQGSIVNISKTTDAIMQAKQEAEESSGLDLRSVYVSVGGLNIKSFTSRGIAAVENKEVTAHEVQQVLKTARAVPFKDDRQILHALPREYNLDGQKEIYNPIGMKGVRLEADVHLVTAYRTVFPNIVTSIENAGLKVKDFVLQTYASSHSVLTKEEKDLGVCLVEMGGGTCEWMTFKNGVVTDTGAIAIGGSNFTNDISYGLRTPSHEAEKIKVQYGNCAPEPEFMEDTFEISDISGSSMRTVTVNQLKEILSPRALETLRLIISDVSKCGHGSDDLTAGFVLTGGASQLKGLETFAQNQFEESIRVAQPKEVTPLQEGLSDASFSCAIGLIQFASSQMNISDRVVRFHERPKLSETTESEEKTEDSTKSQNEEETVSFAQQFKEFIGL